MHRTFFAALVALCLAGFAPKAAAQSEDTVKAAFLYNFCKFTEWPATSFKSASAPLMVGFVGGGSLSQVFDQNVQGKNANGRDFATQSVSGTDAIGPCNVIYVADPAQVGAYVAAARGKPILVVAEGDSALAGGAAIALTKDGSKILFDLNLAAVSSAGLKTDPKLSKIARSTKG